ncbi:MULTISPECIES: SWIM zinc finger family protein [Kamptonema]|uniref:SWIM zinc finger family protein n=1 Tax=Kamptonema TaxID=1501433 RepID=UPI0001C49959|nr:MULTISPECIES: SWIM zinc finger family protein [Kamptonema]ACJ46059.4 zinc finger SWIM domain protein [Kamptonema sp. PCC 6506]CBN58630.1 Zinc finger, SWIM domain protein [Kamptonema sp. PCC 6506]
MPIPKFAEATLRQNSSPQSFERGETYYRNDAVEALTLRGKILQAEVEGSQAPSYRVRLSFESQNLAEASCTCAYSFGGWCKHIVATLLVCLHQPQKIEERPTLEHLLDRLNHQQTQLLLQNLAAEQPDLIDRIERHINRIVSVTRDQKSPTVSPKISTINTAPYRQQVRQILRDAERYLEDGDEEDPITPDILDLISEAQEFSQCEDGNNAIAILQSITETCIEHWDDVADYGAYNEGIVEALNEAWTEAILCAELTKEQQIELQENLTNWQDEWDANFAMSLEALRQGWDFPPLQLILQGNILERGVWEGEAPDYAEDIALIRLQILERRERYEEYLYLAKAEGMNQQYLVMLVSLGRISEAISTAKTLMTSVEEAKALAFELRKQGAKSQALEVAQAGFSLEGHCLYELATWASNLALELGDCATAMKAKIKAFSAQPSFEDYQNIKELSGEEWETLKVELLTNISSQDRWGIQEAKVNIFLHEGLIDKAIEVVTPLSYYHSRLIHQVMEAAIPYRPDWVIKNASQEAESIVNRGKADVYDVAIQWLHKVRSAYLQSNRQSDWLIYRNSLVEQHGRKRKFMELLKPLT